MDKVLITGLEIEAIVGVYAWERDTKQTVIVDLEMATDIAKAAATDDLMHACDYDAIAKRLLSFVEASSYQLVETLAEEIAKVVRQEFDVPWVRVTLHKPSAVKKAADVAIRIERGQAGY
ncbi:MAG: dihydroneopterin aldolase [Pseudomonadota bacterium]